MTENQHLHPVIRVIPWVALLVIYIIVVWPLLAALEALVTTGNVADDILKRLERSWVASWAGSITRNIRKIRESVKS